MSFFITPNETCLDAITNEVENRPEFRDRFQALHDLRQNGDPLSTTPGFRRIASVVGPLHTIAELLEPGMANDKRKLYAWLDKHPRFLTYDRRAAMARTGKTFHGWAPDEVPVIGGLPDGSSESV